MAADILSSANFSTFAPVAREAAFNAGVPESIFLSLINSESSFNPFAYNPSGAAGIAQFMPSTADELGIDPFNPNAALNASAQYLKKAYDKYGNWQAAIKQYKGYGNDMDNPVGIDRVNKVMADALELFGGKGEDQIPWMSESEARAWTAGAEERARIEATSSDPIWKWNVSDWKNYFKNSAYGFMLGAVGVLFIVGSIWFLLKGNREKIIAVTNTSINPLKK